MKKWGNKIERVLAADPGTLKVRLAYVDGSTFEVSLASIFGAPRGLAAEVISLRGTAHGEAVKEAKVNASRESGGLAS